jgi:hypothetical protein
MSIRTKVCHANPATGEEEISIVFFRNFRYSKADIRVFFIPVEILADQYIYYKYHPRRYYGHTRSG